MATAISGVDSDLLELCPKVCDDLIRQRWSSPVWDGRHAGAVRTGGLSWCLFRPDPETPPLWARGRFAISRSCSLACDVLFEADTMAAKEVMDRRDRKTRAPSMSIVFPIGLGATTSFILCSRASLKGNSVSVKRAKDFFVIQRNDYWTSLANFAASWAAFEINGISSSAFWYMSANPASGRISNSIQG